MKISGVLFDLDGTLLDTLPDLTHVLNELLIEQGEKPQDLSEVREHISQGARALQIFLSKETTETEKALFLQNYLTRYEHCGFEATQIFPEGLTLLNILKKENIPWGIVTNKLSRHAVPLLKKFEWFKQSACLVCADTFSEKKPHPLPVQEACKILHIAPQECLFIGDDLNDVLAGKGAHTQTGVILHGYINSNINPYNWQADHYFSNFQAVINHLEKILLPLK